MTHTVVVAAPAERPIRLIDEWWRGDRPPAPLLFGEELAACVETVATHPGVGARVHRRVPRGLRRYLLRASRYHVYYLATDRVVTVLAVWSAVRGNGPPLSMLSVPR